jgi:hypothetical protein
MTARWTVRAGLALVCAGLWAGELRALLTIDQAKALSQKTGRPIFAVAGSAT